MNAYPPLMLFLGLALTSETCWALTVLTPATSEVEIMAGDDFAAQVMADAWDMGNMDDVQLPESISLASQQFASGIYSATATTSDPYFFPLYQGVTSSVATHNGARWPIDTGRYRYVTARIRMTSTVSATVPPPQRAFQIYFYRDQNSIVEGTYGCSRFAYYAQDSWQIVMLDMQEMPSCAGQNVAWTTFPHVQGLRVDPVAAPDTRIEIDWLRLTAPPAHPAQSFLVQWSDVSGGHLYSIDAVDAGGARARLASDVTGAQHLVDMTRLPPGTYRIAVTRNGATDESPGSLRINTPPSAVIARPNVRGDQARSYASIEAGNPWGPMDPADILLSLNMTAVSYANPPGTFSARPTSGDPYLFFATPTPIDATHYRSLCYTMQVSGNRDIGAGSVARVMWGAQSSVLTTTDDIIVEAGLVERCLPDLARVPDEGADAGPWTGFQNFIRLDPHEFPVSAACMTSPSPANCRDVRIDSFVLSPFFEASPAFDFSWTLDDPDDPDAQIRIYLDPDRNPENGNWTLLASVPASIGPGGHTWEGGGVANGVYNVYVQADDGLNTAGTYAGGPLRVVGGDPIFADGFDHQP